MAGACERGFRGYIVPGTSLHPTSYASLGRLGRVQVSVLSFGIAPRGVFRPAPTLEQKIGPNLSKVLFFAFHLILGKQSDQV